MSATQIRGGADVKDNTVVNADIVSLAWSKLTGTPTDLAGYGITSPLPVAQGGTAIASYAVGDLVYASGSTTLSKLAAVATGSVLVSAGVTTAPAWANTLNLGTNTYAKASQPAGSIALDKGTSTSPGIHFYTAANTNWGIDNANTTLRFVQNLDESGGVVRMSIDNNGLLTLTYPGPATVRINDTGANGGAFDLVSNVVGSTATWSVTDGSIYLLSVQKTTSRVGIKNNAPTAMLHLPAGAAAASSAPLKFTAGTNLSTAELGAMEFTDNGTTGHLYITLNVASVLTRVQIV